MIENENENENEKTNKKTSSFLLKLYEILEVYLNKLLKE